MLPRVLICSVLAVLLSVVVASAEEPSSQPYVVLSGSDSSVAKEDYSRITTAERWSALWEKHVAGRRNPGELGTFEVPAADFQRCMVTAIFLGSTVNVEGLAVEQTLNQEKEIVLRVDILSYQTGGDYDKVTPYAFLIMPRSDKPILIQIDSRGLEQIADNLPPIWKDFARIETHQPQK